MAAKQTSSGNCRRRKNRCVLHLEAPLIQPRRSPGGCTDTGDYRAKFRNISGGAQSDSSEARYR
jgi:hypothetical protein